ncbi:MAG: RsmD family RNA methyltransferase, partial [Alcaligenaceae bacterium]|nr:RsmD family RNA methyltransferase [Alcaligenaceae bacterium]
MKTHQIRIISGQFNRRLIPVLDMEGLRPTPDRVRQTLFNWLDHLWGKQYQDKSCLDLFAGTGALSFEIISRGALQATLVERNKQVASQLQSTKK